MNKNFAIRGHLRRGDEVIKILEMLGGKTSYECSYKDGFDSSYFFFINTDENFSIDGLAYNSEELKNYYIFTLEEFLKKFPYKVGDKVTVTGLPEYPKSINFMKWFDGSIHYSFDSETWFLPESLKIYKEETIDIKYNVEEYLKVWEETEKGLEVVVNDNFELKEDNGKFYIIKKQNEYPKTYEECCEVLFPSSIELGKVLTCGYNCEKLKKFGELLICRDAYWKIAGEQMELGKPWEPDWRNNCYQKKWIINFYQGEINLTTGTNAHFVLAFPTEEMRDAFYEYFKDLIEHCKEFL